MDNKTMVGFIPTAKQAAFLNEKVAKGAKVSHVLRAALDKMIEAEGFTFVIPETISTNTAPSVAKIVP